MDEFDIADTLSITFKIYPGDEVLRVKCNAESTLGDIKAILVQQCDIATGVESVWLGDVQITDGDLSSYGVEDDAVLLVKICDVDPGFHPVHHSADIHVSADRKEAWRDGGDMQHSAISDFIIQPGTGIWEYELKVVQLGSPSVSLGLWKGHMLQSGFDITKCKAADTYNDPQGPFSFISYNSYNGYLNECTHGEFKGSRPTRGSPYFEDDLIKLRVDTAYSGWKVTWYQNGKHAAGHSCDENAFTEGAYISVELSEGSRWRWEGGKRVD